MVLITKPGEALPKVEKRAEEQVVYKLDLSNILEFNEAAIEILSTNSTIHIDNVRTKLGKFIEVCIPPSNNGASQFLEYQTTIRFKTTLNNIKVAAFNLRVYK